MNDQHTFDFAVEAQKTASPFFHTEKVHPDDLYAAMREAVRALDIVDKMRKAIFYENLEYVPGEQHGLVRGVARLYPDLDPHLIHGILGAACEGGEKLDLLIRAFDGETFDRTNYIEECGDGLWYDQIGLTVCGTDIEETTMTVIKKLRQRTGESFSKDSFNERDLLSERKVLEEAVTPANKGAKERVQKQG